MASEIEVRPIAGAVGAELHGVNLAGNLPDGTLSDIKAALAEWGVVFFRDQTLTPGQHLAFARHFGPVNVNRFFRAVEGWPMIAEVRKEPQQKSNIGGGWHTDHSYDAIPALGSILHAIEVPEFGGDTMFSSMYAAYDALSDGLKHTLAGLRAVHSSRHVFGPAAKRAEDMKDRIGNPELATQDATHPVVIQHPDTGRKALYVNPGFTLHFEGWTAEESQSLLSYLYKHATRPEFTCRFAWRPGSIAFWDNRTTWHMAINDYHGHRRLMHRITVEGVALH